MGESDSLTIKPRKKEGESSYDHGRHIFRFAFEAILGESRVYRKARSSECDRSFNSSVPRSHASTLFSELDVTDISLLSVVALPVFSSDLDVVESNIPVFGAASQQLIPLASFATENLAPKSRHGRLLASSGRRSMDRVKLEAMGLLPPRMGASTTTCLPPTPAFLLGPPVALPGNAA